MSDGNYNRLIFLRRQNITLLACSAINFFVVKNDPLYPSKIPRYLYPLTVSISCLLKITVSSA